MLHAHDIIWKMFLFWSVFTIWLFLIGVVEMLYPSSASPLKSYSNYTYEGLFFNRKENLERFQNELSDASLCLASIISLALLTIWWPLHQFLTLLYTVCWLMYMISMIAFKKEVAFPKRVKLVKAQSLMILIPWKLILEYPFTIAYNRSYIILKSALQERPKAPLLSVLLTLTLNALGFSPYFVSSLDALRWGLYNVVSTDLTKKKKRKRILIRLWLLGEEIRLGLCFGGGEAGVWALERKIRSKPLYFNPGTEIARSVGGVARRKGDKLVTVYTGKKNLVGHLGIIGEGGEGVQSPRIITTGPIPGQLFIGLPGIKSFCVMTFNNVVDKRLISLDTTPLVKIVQGTGLSNEFMVRQYIVETWFLRAMMVNEGVVYQYPLKKRGSGARLIKKGLFYENWLNCVEEEGVEMGYMGKKKLETFANITAKISDEVKKTMEDAGRLFITKSLERSGVKYIDVGIVDDRPRIVTKINNENRYIGLPIIEEFSIKNKSGLKNFFEDAPRLYIEKGIIASPVISDWDQIFNN